MEYYLTCANKGGSNCIANFLEFVGVVLQKPVCEPFLFGEMTLLGERSATRFGVLFCSLGNMIGQISTHYSEPHLLRFFLLGMRPRPR